MTWRIRCTCGNAPRRWCSVHVLAHRARIGDRRHCMRHELRGWHGVAISTRQGSVTDRLPRAILRHRHVAQPHGLTQHHCRTLLPRGFLRMGHRLRPHTLPWRGPQHTLQLHIVVDVILPRTPGHVVASWHMVRLRSPAQCVVRHHHRGRRHNVSSSFRGTRLRRTGADGHPPLRCRRRHRRRRRGRTRTRARQNGRSSRRRRRRRGRHRQSQLVPPCSGCSSLCRALRHACA